MRILKCKLSFLNLLLSFFASSKMVLSSTLCQACPLEGKVRCTGCVKIGVTTRYCSQTCQQILWITHKDHCGKNNGLFFHPKPTEDEAMKCVRGILGQEASDNFESEYNLSISIY